MSTSLPMITLQLSIYAMAIALCAFTGLLAWRSLFRSRAFYGFIVLLALMFCCDWLMHHPNTPLKSLWLLGLMICTFLIAPCVLRLAQTVSLGYITINWRKHIGLLILGWFLLIPLATAIHWGTSFTKQGNPTPAEYALFIHTTMLLSIALFCVQTGWALQNCMAFLRERSAQNHALFSTFDDQGENTLRILLLIVVANAAIAATRVLYCALLDNVYMALNLTITLAQLAMIVYLAGSFIQQQITSLKNSSERLRQHLLEDSQEAPLPIAVSQYSNTKSTSKYRKSCLAPTRQTAIIHSIEQAVFTDQLFTQAGLSLNDLCEHIGESAHHVSQAISQSSHNNFYDLINQQRAVLAANLLIEKPNATILSIGFDCGFNSKSSFNSVFKKYHRLTPSQYRSQYANTCVPHA